MLKGRAEKTSGNVAMIAPVANPFAPHGVNRR
jgi:hypothetical protein